VTANKQEKANRLLEALVVHLSESLDPDRVDDWLEQELDDLLAQADTVRLGEVVTAEQIGTTVRKYAVQMELGGGIPELVGEMVDRLYNHGIQAERRVGELVDERTVAALVDKVLEIPLSRRGVGCRSGCWSAPRRCCPTPGCTATITWASCGNWCWWPGRISPSAR
jgi:hypothetical protein